MSDKNICRGRGRPRGFCVEQAVERALELFRARGYDAVSVADLSEAIGVAPPSLYAAFGSKTGLYARALDLYQEREGGFMSDVLALPGDARAILADLFHRAAQAFADQPNGCLVCRGEQGCADEDAAKLTFDRRQAARTLIEQRLGDSGAADASFLADYALAGLHALTGAVRDGIGPDRLREIADALAAGIPAAPRQG